MLLIVEIQALNSVRNTPSVDYENHRAVLLRVFVISNSLSEYWVKGIVRHMLALLTGYYFFLGALYPLLFHDVVVPSSTKEPSRRHGNMVKKVGKYEIGKTIGEGTFGKVKLATNTETGEKLAIKVRDVMKVMYAHATREDCFRFLAAHPPLRNI